MSKFYLTVILFFLIFICSIETKEDEKILSYFFPGFPFPPGINFPRDFFPNIRPPSRPRPTRPPQTNRRERCPSEGIKLISHPTDCERYILCVDGEEISEFECPNGFHFSRITRSCVDYRVAGCEEYEWVCPEQDSINAVFIPNQKNCSAYYFCWQGNKIPMTCSLGQHWSIFENACMDPIEANCIFSYKESFKKAVSVQNETIPAKNFGICPVTGIVSIPKPSSCEEFYLCIDGFRIERQCQAGLHFSPTLLVCVPPDIAQCVRNDCPSNGLEFLPHEDNCNKYYLCFNGDKIIMTCPNDLNWSTVEKRCMNPEDAGCKEPNDLDECPATGVVQIPNLKYCEKFILCVNGLEISLPCGPGLHFSRKERTCMSPDKAGCELYQCPEEDTPGIFVFIPNTENCEKYYLCWQGNQIPLRCPASMHWSIGENRCLPQNVANCTWTKDKGDEECPEKGILAISHPSSCEQYILCVNGHMIDKRECPNGLHFSRETRVCVHPSIANCLISENL